MIDIPYTDSNITYAGRWVDYGDSIGSNWQGSQIRFKVSGTSFLYVKADVLDATTNDVSGVVINVDGGPTQLKGFSAAETITIGKRSLSIPLPGSGEHEIVLKLFGVPVSQVKGSSYTRLVSIGVEDSGHVIEATKADNKVVFVGDSWMAIQNDWPRMLDQTKFDVNPVSFGGASSSDLNKYFGISSVPTSDVDAVVIGSGVNDYMRRVSVDQYKDSMRSLIYKVKKTYKGASIVLIQAPKNIHSNRDFGKYGGALEDLSIAISGVSYVPFPASRLGDIEWAKDGLHLTPEGLKVYSEILSPSIEASFREKVLFPFW